MSGSALKATRLSQSASSCPSPVREYAEVLLAHGGGGSLSAELVENTVLPRLASASTFEMLHDGATFDVPAGRLCFTTDSFVVRPLFFPGGDVGSLAVHGTVNDLAMCGGTPWLLSLSFIIEEGLAMKTFESVTDSISEAASSCGVQVVTGDTKVVERGKADGLYINTSGIGIVPIGVRISPRCVQEGDAVVLSGPIAEHGMAVMSRREGLEFESQIESDSAPVHEAVLAVLNSHSASVRCLRDPTRGGVASALVEIAETAGLGFRLEEERIPIEESVRAACEFLGIDPLHVASEGRFLLICAADRADAIVDVLRRQPQAEKARVVGHADRTPGNCVVLAGPIGGERVVDRFRGEQLPRIC